MTTEKDKKIWKKSLTTNFKGIMADCRLAIMKLKRKDVTPEEIKYICKSIQVNYLNNIILGSYWLR